MAEHQAPVALSSKAAADSRFKFFPALVEDTYEAFLSVPLINKGKVIGVINVHHREQHAHTAEEISTIQFMGEQMGSAIAKSLLEEENARLTEETAEVRRQLETRKVVERAKGILQHRQNLTEEEAYLRMRNESRRLRRPMKELAEAIILAEELGRKESAPRDPREYKRRESKIAAARYPQKQGAAHNASEYFGSAGLGDRTRNARRVPAPGVSQAV